MKNKKGFTLIELLVVIAIIGLLSTLAVVALNSARQKSRDSKRVADIKQIQTALELYFADSTDGYPTEAEAIILGDDVTALCTAGFGGACDAGTTYMGLVPKAPVPSDCDPDAEVQNDYSYTGGGNDYHITFCLGNKVGDLVAGGMDANPNGIQPYVAPEVP
jgi:general secretion pathway protein G